MRRATITGWGKCVPPAVLSNSDLEKLTDTSDEWITTRTGIKERHITHVETSDMATVAGHHALAAAGVDATEIDVIIVATCTPDRLLPSAASFVQPELGAVNAGVMDINAVCSGFLYGIIVANGLIASRAADKVLLIGSEKMSVLLDMNDRSTAVLFGDGAGAVVLEATEGPDGVLSTNLGTDGTLAHALTASGFGTENEVPPEIDHKIYMNGREIYRNAVIEMGKAATKAVEDAGMGIDDVDLLIPHQANSRIIDAVARRIRLPDEKVYMNIASYGNTSAASIPIALTDALEEGRIAPGDLVVFVAFGSGLTWGAATVRWGERTKALGTSDARLPDSDQTGAELMLAVEERRRARRGG